MISIDICYIFLFFYIELFSNLNSLLTLINLMRSDHLIYEKIVKNTALASFLDVSFSAIHIMKFCLKGFSLWKPTKNVQHQTVHNSAIKKSNGDWAKNDTEISDTFACHLDELQVFSPFPRDSSISAIEEEHITNLVRHPETELEPITRVNCI